MSQAPTDMLASRHKEYAKARERYQRATAARFEAQERVRALESELAKAESRDRIALGDALVDQRRRPASEAEQVRARLEEAKREAEALAYAQQRAATQLDQLPRQHRDEWLQQANSDLAKFRDAYQDAIRALADARDRLANQATLVSFLEYGQETQPIGAGLRSVASDGSPKVYDFGQLVALMLAEAATVAEAAMLDPSRPRPEPQFHRAFTA